MRVLLGVTGGIAAYKVALVARALAEDGHDVRVVPTAASLNFVGRATWEALTGNPATSDTFADVPSVQHVRLGQRADAILVAPATADFLAQFAHGEARDLLGNALLVATCPIVVAPAMHTEMWRNPATQANVVTLRERGVTVLEPAVGRLTGADSGPGRLPDPEKVVAALYAAVDGAADGVTVGAVDDGGGWGDLGGLTVLVTAGGTREPIDPVRYLGNRSSGHQGFALAEAARERGAAVELIAANVSLPSSEGVARTDVETTADLADAVARLAPTADVVIMAAAVADFRPRTATTHKLKKSDDGITLDLEKTEDILAGLVATRPQGQTVVGFAAETGDASASAAEHASAKARRKRADLLVFNEVGVDRGFGNRPNDVRLLNPAGEDVGHAAGSKLAVAHAILDAVVALRRGGAVTPAK